jgi:protein-S-isoprenylcysteine O-methyltransferase Ste14
MALIHSFEKNGNFLFKYRGQIPLILFILILPVIFLTDYSFVVSNPAYDLYFLIGCIAVSFLGQIIRAIAIGTSNKYTSGRNTKEQVAEALNTKGIYSTVRHPLYLGNYFMWIGIVLYSYNLWFFILVSLLFWLYYERIMFAEERFLERKFGQSYIDWSMNVPPFIPSFKNFDRSEISFSFKTILRREYSGVSATIIGFVFVAFLKQWKINGTPNYDLNYGIWIGVAFLFSFIFRTLKHNTKLLFEDDRS